MVGFFYLKSRLFSDGQSCRLSEQKNEQKTMKTIVPGWTNTDEKRNGFPYFRRRPFSTHCLISKLQLQREGVTPGLKKTNAIFRFEQSVAKVDRSTDILVRSKLGMCWMLQNDSVRRKRGAADKNVRAQGFTTGSSGPQHVVPQERVGIVGSAYLHHQPCQPGTSHAPLLLAMAHP